MNKILYRCVKKISIPVFLVFSFVNVSIAQIGSETVFGFLNVTESARTAALGGNHVSLDEGGVSLFTTNPAYLNKSTHKQFSVSYLNHLSDIYLGIAAFSYDMNGIGTFATGIRFVNYGEFTRLNSDGNEQGSFSAYDFSWGTAISRPLLNGLQAGIGTQIIISRYDTYRSSAAAIFGGFYYSFNNDFTRAGASFRNLGIQLTKFDESSEAVPFNITVGITHQLQHLPLRFNLAMHSLNRWEIPVFDDEEAPGFTKNFFRHLRLGGEILLSENVTLRLGYDRLMNEELKTDRRIDFSGISFGIGFVIREIRIDFSRTSYSETGGLMQLNMSTYF
ncbi:MAG: type IX secretion system protein PorQ [Balneolales bacterium]